MGCATPPTEPAVIVSNYGFRPGRLTGERRFHAGLDLRGPPGDTVRAAAPGIVETVVDEDMTARSLLGVSGRAFRGYGRVVVVHHTGLGTWSSYNHLSRVLVSPGQFVTAGQPLGTVGNTSNGKFPGMGAHLHFEVRHAEPATMASPFPGTYGTTSLDPVQWLATIGVRREGGRLVELAGPCVAPGTPEQLTRTWITRGRGQAKALTGEEYEPPKELRALAEGVLLGSLLGASILVGGVLLDRWAHG